MPKVEKLAVQKVARTSADIPDENLQKLRAVFPQFVKDGEVDIDALKSFFEKEGALASSEKYGLSWAGKSNAFSTIRTPATGTLVPQEKESKDWQHTENVFIEGDNLEVLKLLQKQYREQIKMIYIDPPYNTGKDFVYKDNFTQSVADYYEQTGQTQGGIKMTANTEKNGRYHSDWLTMMYPRLFLAKNLLRQDGVIFISIDDNEVHNLRLVMDEIFGEENFLAQIVWQKRYGRNNDAKLFSTTAEYILCYRRSESVSFLRETRTEANNEHYSNPDNDTRGPWTSVSYIGQRTKTERQNLAYQIIRPQDGIIIDHPTNAWKFSEEKHREHLLENRLYWGADGKAAYPRLKKFLSEVEEGGIVPTNLWSFQEAGSGDEATREVKELLGKQIFNYPKPIKLVRKMMRMFEAEGVIVLDFFAGSGTTAHAVMDLNAEDGGSRRWISVQLPETTDEKGEAYKAGYKTIADIARERIRRAGVSAISRSASDEAISSLESRPLDTGFKSYKLVPSNYRVWQNITADDGAEKFLEQATLFAEKPLVDHYEERAVVYEVLLKEGFSLNAAVMVPDSRANMPVWTVTEHEKKLLLTFAPIVTKEQVENLGLTESDTFVCFDSALDDTTKVNIARSVNVKTI